MFVESLHYGGGDSSYGSNSAGHNNHCCCANGDPNSPGSSFQSSLNHPPSSGSCSQTACAGCSSSAAAATGSIASCNIVTSTGPVSSSSSGGGSATINAGSTLTSAITPTSAITSIPSAVKFELGRIEVCEGCGLGIADRYVMRVADGSWHEDCLVCCICHAPLVHSCFTRSGRVYCRQDYDRYSIVFYNIYFLLFLLTFRFEYRSFFWGFLLLGFTVPNVEGVANDYIRTNWS